MTTLPASHWTRQSRSAVATEMDVILISGEPCDLSGYQVYRITQHAVDLISNVWKMARRLMASTLMISIIALTLHTTLLYIIPQFYTGCERNRSCTSIIVLWHTHTHTHTHTLVYLSFLQDPSPDHTPFMLHHSDWYNLAGRGEWLCHKIAAAMAPPTCLATCCLLCQLL